MALLLAMGGATSTRQVSAGWEGAPLPPPPPRRGLRKGAPAQAAASPAQSSWQAGCALQGSSVAQGRLPGARLGSFRCAMPAKASGRLGTCSPFARPFGSTRPQLLGAPGSLQSWRSAVFAVLSLVGRGQLGNEQLAWGRKVRDKGRCVCVCVFLQKLMRCKQNRCQNWKKS